MKSNKPNKNRPSSLYTKKVGDMMLFEDDRYCAGHKSNGRYHKKLTRVLRSKIKAETKQMIEAAEDFDD